MRPLPLTCQALLPPPCARSDHQRELAETASRAGLMQQQLEEARTQVCTLLHQTSAAAGAHAAAGWTARPCQARRVCALLPLTNRRPLSLPVQLRQEAAAAGELRSRVMALEEDLEASKLQLVAAQQSAALAAAAGAAGGAAVAASAEGEAQRRRLESELAQRQRAAEERAAQLDALGRRALGGAACGLIEAYPEECGALLNCIVVADMVRPLPPLACTPFHLQRAGGRACQLGG